MRIGLVVDSGCDLPKSFIDDNQIVLLPITIKIDNDELVDHRDPDPTLDFYKYHIGDKGHDAESAPFSTDQIKKLFLEQLVIDYDYVICETIMRTRSPIFENATKASFGILNGYKPVRKSAGIEGPFSLRVIDSKNLFAGQGVLAAETIRLIKSGMQANDIRQKIEQLTASTFAYGVPPDLYYIRSRAKKKGDKSVGWLSATLGSALDIKPVICAHNDDTQPVAKVKGWENAVHTVFRNITQLIRNNFLLSPHVAISYAGDPSVIDSLPGYAELEQAAIAHDITLLKTLMSVTGGVNLGPGTLTVGVISKPHAFKG